MKVFSKNTIYLFLFLVVIAGCKTTNKGNDGNVQSFTILSQEAEWIRNGEPIIFENESWYPVDGIETLTDTEVYLLGEYRGVQFFVDKIDIRPYDRLYTKFGRNQFRYYRKPKNIKQ